MDTPEFSDWLKHLGLPCYFLRGRNNPSRVRTVDGRIGIEPSPVYDVAIPLLGEQPIGADRAETAVIAIRRINEHFPKFYACLGEVDHQLAIVITLRTDKHPPVKPLFSRAAVENSKDMRFWTPDRTIAREHIEAMFSDFVWPEEKV